jgi:photosystem II stability/assembly factor-like uncharacterized protein
MSFGGIASCRNRVRGLFVRRRLTYALAVAAAAAVTTGAGAAVRGYDWELTQTGSTARLRGLSAVSDDVAWTSGSLGTVLRTANGGAGWQDVSPPGASALQFRDIEAFDEDHAVILSIGTGTDSRIYVTADGGATWALTFTNNDPNAFYDCLTFFDQKRGLALSDPVDGRFRILATEDGGLTWQVVDADMPPALAGEFAFAASGQCLVSDHGHSAWFATGGGAEARVFRSPDRGRTWTVSSTPIPSGPSAGIFALAFRGQEHGLAVGGDFAAPTNAPDGAVLSEDGGATWTLAAAEPGEYRSGVAWVDGHTAIAVGPSGSDVSTDGGATWSRFDDGSFDTVDCARPNACWASGESGRVAVLVRPS